MRGLSLRLGVLAWNSARSGGNNTAAYAATAVAERRAVWYVRGYTELQTPPTGHGVPDAFLNKFGQHMTGALCGFNRLLFQASIRVLFNPKSMEDYLLVCGSVVKPTH